MVGGLDRKTKAQIIQAIRRAEEKTSGEICVHIQRTCKDDVLEEARRHFVKLGMHRTRDRSGVLIFAALKTRKFAIIGDSGIHGKTGPSFWDQTRDIMAKGFEAGSLGEAIVSGVECAGEKLAQFFPRRPDDANELPNRVTQG